MKRSDLFRYICVAVICLCGHSVGDSLCERDGSLSILSIFNLKTDVIIQTTNGQTINFWRITENERQDFKSISNDTKQFLYKEKPFIIPVNPSAPGYESIDDSKRVFGYMIPISSRYWKKCANQKSPSLDTESCTLLEKMFDRENEDFVCIHGKSKGAQNSVTNVYVYNSKEGFMSFITQKALNDYLLGFCRKSIYYDGKYYSAHIVSLTNWPELDYRSEFFGNLTLIEDKRGSQWSVKLLAIQSGNYEDLQSTYVTTHTLPLDPNYFYNIFRFNSYYKYMICGLNCNLDSQLQWISLMKWSDRISQMGQPPTKNVFGNYTLSLQTMNITIRKLLGCQLPIQQTLDPTLFCHKNRVFLSVFSLGKDVYFQGSGRFWQLPHNRFTDAVNRRLSPAVRYESDFTALVERESIDTFSPVYGFTLTAPYPDPRPYCGQQDLKCIQKHQKSKEFFWVCLYGERKEYKKEVLKKMVTSTYDVVRAFHYTPGGMTQLKSKRLETYEFCLEFSKMLNKEDKYLRSVTSVVEHPTDADENLVFGYFFTSAANYLVQYKWKNYLAIDESLIKQIQKEEFFVEADGKIFLFHYMRNTYGYGIISDFEHAQFKQVFELDSSLFESASLKNNIKHLKVTIDSKRIDLTLVHLNCKPKPKTDVYNLFKCPFKSSVSLVTSKREDICMREKPSKSESVFSVGSRLYYQIGQHFYAYDSIDRSFIYDKMASDLFHEYFDTNQRLTGFAFRSTEENVVYEVMIHGKSAHKYQYLGQYISGLFEFDKELAYFKAFTKQIHQYIFPSVPIGIISPIEYDGFINYMGGFQTSFLNGRKEFIWVWIRDLVNQSQYKMITDQGATAVLNEVSEKVLEDRIKHLSLFPYKDVKFDSIFIGLFANETLRQIYLVARPKNDLDKLEMYEVAGWQGIDDTEGILWSSNIPDFKKLPYTFYDSYCSNAKKSYDSLSDVEKKWQTFYSILLLLLLIMGILIAYFTFQMDQKKATKTKSDAKRMQSVETLEPHRPNYTVIRQPEPDVDNSDELDAKTVRSDGL